MGCASVIGGDFEIENTTTTLSYERGAMNILTASAMAKSLAEACPQYAHNTAFKDQMTDRLTKHAVVIYGSKEALPDVEDRFMTEGGELTVATKARVASRALGYMTSRGIVPGLSEQRDCAVAAKEVQNNTMIGRFLQAATPATNQMPDLSAFYDYASDVSHAGANYIILTAGPGDGYLFDTVAYSVITPDDRVFCLEVVQNLESDTGEDVIT
ncbi:MAG: hypothetical protein AAF701_05610, partial [Pseudomonadota bacterium]